MSTAQRILLVGWSAADWRLLEPLLKAGEMPNLRRLVKGGASGNLRTLQPQLPPLLWTSIATGYRADMHGVLHTLLPDSSGSIRPLSRLDRQCRAIWNITGEKDNNNILVNWPVTFPAEPISGACVSDLFFRLTGSEKGLDDPAPGATYPPELAENILDLRFSANELTLDEMAFFIPDIERAELEGDSMPGRLAVALAETISTQAVTMHLIQESAWDLAMVRYDILETLGPEFMACYPPQLSYVPDKLFERYREIIPAVCRYLDLMLGVLLEQTGPDTLVVVFSDRGIHSDHLRPQDPDVAFRQSGGVPWFREQGILTLHGPGVTADASIQGAGLLDIVPTILRYMDIPVGKEMPGRVLKEAFSMLPEEQDDAAHEAPIPGSPDFSISQLSEKQCKVALRRWQEIGLLDNEDTGIIEEIDKARCQREFNRAMVTVEARKSRRALKQLEQLHQEYPDDDRIALHLARCRRNTGDLAGAKQLLEKVVDHPDQRPYEQMQLAQLHLATGEHDKALLCLFRAEHAVAERPGVHSQIGQVYLAMQRWDEAERAFGKALERDTDHAEAHRGMAAVHLGLKRYEETIDAALRAIELDRNRPQTHYFLGAALLAEKRVGVAAQAFQTCLELNADHVSALRGLADSCQLLGDDSAASAHRKRAHQLESAALLKRQLPGSSRSPG